MALMKSLSTNACLGNSIWSWWQDVGTTNTAVCKKKRPKRAKDCRSFHLDLFNIITQAVSTSKKINCSSLLQPFGGWCTCTWFEILCLLFFWSTSFFFLSFLTKKCANFLAQRWSHDCCSRTNNKIWCRSYWSYYYHLRKTRQMGEEGRGVRLRKTGQNRPTRPVLE